MLSVRRQTITREPEPNSSFVQGQFRATFPLIIAVPVYRSVMTKITALRVALTLAFVYFGLRKLTGYSTDIAIYDAIGIGQFPRYITGSVELLGAALLWRRGSEGLAALILLATVMTGLGTLLVRVGPPYLHMVLLIAGTATLVHHHRQQLWQLTRAVTGNK